MLSTEDIRRWGRRKKPGFVQGCMSRELGFQKEDYPAWLKGKRPIPIHHQRVLSRFIEDWEAGLIDFVRVSRKGAKPRDGLGKRGGIIYRMVRRTTPRPMPIQMNVRFEGGRARLSFIAKPVRLRMPSFPDVTGKLTRR